MSESTSMQGRTCLVTGANTGIGRATAVELARRGARVVVACRTEERARAVLADIRALGGESWFLPLDLGSFASIRAAAQTTLEREPALHVLIDNAGVAGQRGLTTDGFELQFGVNHLGHFLLTNLLLERIVASAPARIVVVSSAAHARAKGIDFTAVQRRTRSLTGWPEYQVSKLANALFSAELARRLEGQGVSTYAVHPGVVASDLWRRLPWPIRKLATRGLLTNEEGARTSVHCACAPEVADQTGLYWDESAPRKPSRYARDPELARVLWERSAAWTGVG